MAEPNYYIGSMGNLFHASGKPIFGLPNERGEMPQLESEKMRKGQQKPGPVLRLRPDDKGKDKAELRGTLQQQRRKFPDGPWIRHLDEIAENRNISTKDMPDCVTIQENRERHKKDWEELMTDKASLRKNFVGIEYVMVMAQAIDMTRVDGIDQELVDLHVERWFVNSHLYLEPGAAMPPSIRDHFHRDWSENARGVYYRHYYSPEWVSADHSLWIPTLDGVDWDDRTEETRRMRARVFLNHARNNERWNKSEYAWEADAWTDVFGQMRDDPVIAADKHEYCTVRSGVHPVSCVQTGRSKFTRRIPDATFGLATFQPQHYQNALASYELDTERLQALMLHRNCGLLADPRWGETNLAFPFAVYEAKGWNGEPREARQQACSAAAVYLDLLDALARRPGKSPNLEGAYQTVESRSSQVFALTSFGAHWHVMVGYRRPRLAREFAGRAGMSDTVYLFQRIWSGRITTERRAWELISTIDQIHEWGVTDHRDFVVGHLKPWHKFCEMEYSRDAQIMYSHLDHSVPWDGRILKLELPAWTQHLSEDARAKLNLTAEWLQVGAYRKYRAAREKHGDVSRAQWCMLEGCGPYPGYPMRSAEEWLCHFRDSHGFHFTQGSRRDVDKMFSEDKDGGEVWEPVEHDAPTVSSAIPTRPERKRRGVNEDEDLRPGSSKRGRF